MIPQEEFLTQPLVRCVAYCVVFVSALYIYGGIHRSSPRSIRQRIVSALIACTLIFVDTLTFIRPPDKDPWSLDSYDFTPLYLRRQHLALALTLPTLVTSFLFLASLWFEWRSRQFYTPRDYLWELWHNCDLIRLRAVVIAPLVEEFIFRGCILFHLQRQFRSCEALCLGSGLLFAISHFHHLAEKMYEGYTFRAAFSDVFPQVLMTAMFGVYSTLIVLRSGHLMSACAVHSLCNVMGMPDVAWEMRTSEMRDPRWGKRLYIGLLLCGFFSWLLLIGPATTLFGHSTSHSCRLH